MKKYSGNIVDVKNEKVFPGSIFIENGKIVNITVDEAEYETFILPGFIDSHVHIESSMLPPSEFARVAVIHGTVACVSDAHEIANVMGVEGVKYMIENGKTFPFHYYFSAPSCVPATCMETSGAKITAEDIEKMIKEDHVKYLGEMMNFPGVLREVPEVMDKIKVAKKYNLPIDGHAPGLSDGDLEKYVKAGISTDHESFTKPEALEKLKLGMKILIREGSAAKNFNELIPLADEYYEDMMFCSDDKHPNDLIKGHINALVRRSISAGISAMKTLKMACVNPVLHYNLDVGLLQKGDSADFIEVADLHGFEILKTVIKGHVVAENNVTDLPYKPAPIVNNFNISKKKIEDCFVPDKGRPVKVIETIDHQLMTNKGTFMLKAENGNLVSDVENDILKIVVINRYFEAKPGISFVKGFGLKDGAIASSVAHDSHNIIVVGTNDKDICDAANLIIENKGGIAFVSNKQNKHEILPLPIAGLMSNEPYYVVAEKYDDLDILAKINGSKLIAPFMTLSFMALLVIPSIKLSDKGLFDGEKFELTDIYA
ncbi:MAG TPA: adenine deaminase [Bacteroidetes bacterium]|nr:adenine deaminase [Bacteroidota bacterium]